MNFIWGLITGIVVSTICCLIWLKTKKPQESTPKRDITKEAQEKHAEMMKKLEEFLVGKSEVANDEVQNYLGISDASAERYLDELESQGKLTQIGKTGSKTHYQIK